MGNEASANKLVADDGVAFSCWRGYDASGESHCGKREDLGEIHGDDEDSGWEVDRCWSEWMVEEDG